jgi:hypothetical protein
MTVGRCLQPVPYVADCGIVVSGFDDQHGGYKIVIGDHLDFRYEVKGRLGTGTFGQVQYLAVNRVVYR